MANFGICALPDRVSEARAAIDQALQYAHEIQCKGVHLMAGRGQGQSHTDTFIDNLTYAANQAKSYAINILIEPINTVDVPGYFLRDINQAISIIEAVGSPNIGLIYDCHHMQILHGNLFELFIENVSHIFHVQFASIPLRNEPNLGEVDYRSLLNQFIDAGYTGFFGAEYMPLNTTEDGLDWLAELKGEMKQ